MSVGARHEAVLLKSPWSGCMEIAPRVNADGYSRDRVAVCWHRERIPYWGEEEWYRGRMNVLFSSFVSLELSDEITERRRSFFVISGKSGEL